PGPLRADEPRSCRRARFSREPRRHRCQHRDDAPAIRARDDRFGRRPAAQGVETPRVCMEGHHRDASRVDVMIKDFVTVAGLRTHYWHAGSGPVLLMLHGQLPGSCVAVEWGDQVQRFADAGYSVYAIDEAGFGQTDNPRDWSIETRIAHARAFV